MYENAGLADSLCYVNQWDHCTIPIHALEVALKLRQLDTVAFFLKNQDKGKLFWLVTQDLLSKDLRIIICNSGLSIWENLGMTRDLDLEI